MLGTQGTRLTLYKVRVVPRVDIRPVLKILSQSMPVAKEPLSFGSVLNMDWQIWFFWVKECLLRGF